MAWPRLRRAARGRGARGRRSPLHRREPRRLRALRRRPGRPGGEAHRGLAPSASRLRRGRRMAPLHREGPRAAGKFPLERPDGSRLVVEYRARANIIPGVHVSIFRDATARVAIGQRLVDSGARAERLQEMASKLVEASSWTGYLRPRREGRRRATGHPTRVDGNVRIGPQSGSSSCGTWARQASPRPSNPYPASP